MLMRIAPGRISAMSGAKNMSVKAGAPRRNHDVSSYCVDSGILNTFLAVAEFARIRLRGK